MLFSELRGLTEQMQILHLHCTFVFHQQGELPAFKGSTLHGWLGHQLFKEDKELFYLLYGEHDAQQPKPYALACQDYRTVFSKQSTLSFTIILFGNAVSIAERLVDAIARKPLGFGEQRLRINLHSVASQTPAGLRLGIHPVRVADYLEPHPAELIHSCAIQLISPLRLKEQGSIIKNYAPSLSSLLGHIKRRLALLVLFWVDENPLWQSYLKLPVLVGDHQLLDSPVYFEDWLRYSGSRKELLPFGGLLGEICYQGDIYKALAWLEVGELLQIGGKTTFGLGSYRLLV